MEKYILMENPLDASTDFFIIHSYINNTNETQKLATDQQQVKILLRSDDPFLTDVWIGLILILMVLICVGYICICILYHKFRRWKQEVLQAQRTMNNRNSWLKEYAYEENLPSYTIVTGLPSYDQAMEQLRKLRMERGSNFKNSSEETGSSIHKIKFARLSLGDIFQFHKNDITLPS